LVVKKMLSKYGFDVEIAESGEDAIAKIIAKHYDMVFMDHMMPEIDGIEVVKIVCERCWENVQSTIFIALTANVLRGAREMYLENGFHDFLAKPIEKEKLYDMLNKWIPQDKKEYQK